MTTFSAAGGRFREERDPWWFVVDPFLILSVMAITAMGALLVYSATRGPATELDPADTSFLTRQVLFAVVGAGFGLFAALINIERIRSLMGVAYIATLGLLFGVVLFGADINGTQAWYRVGGFTFQPSEPGKLVLIVALATVFSGDRVGFQRMALRVIHVVSDQYSDEHHPLPPPRSITTSPGRRESILFKRETKHLHRLDHTQIALRALS